MAHPWIPAIIVRRAKKATKNLKGNEEDVRFISCGSTPVLPAFTNLTNGLFQRRKKERKNTVMRSRRIKKR